MQISAIGRGSISSFLKLAVDIGWVFACAALGFIWIVTAVSLFSMANGGQGAGLFARISLRDPQELAVWAVIGTVFCVGAMLICSFLRGVFETLVAGDPFVPENAQRLRMIGLSLAVMEAARVFLSVVVQLLLGAFGIAASDGRASIARSINLTVWFAVLTLVVLAQVFAEGARMREEQKMTI